MTLSLFEWNGMFYANKIFFFLANPVSIAAAAFLLAWFLRRRKAFSRTVAAFAAIWIYFWSTDLAARYIGVPVESVFPPAYAEDCPQADMIVLLGGGMNRPENGLLEPEMHDGADRAWFAAKLYKAEKVPKVMTLGVYSDESDAAFLVDYGVPESAIVAETESRNTEENIKRTRELVGGGGRVLVVTSAWHMPRALLMFAKYAPDIEAIPAATDYTFTSNGGGAFRANYLVPNTASLSSNTCLFKELAGYLVYKILR